MRQMAMFPDMIGRDMAKSYRVLSMGAGMQSSALFGYSLDNLIADRKGLPRPYPKVPVYDAIIYIKMEDRQIVEEQSLYFKRLADKYGMRYEILRPEDTGKDLMEDYLRDYGHKSVRSIPFWTLEEVFNDEGNPVIDPKTGKQKAKKGRMPRICTMDYKINLVMRYVKYNILGFKPRERLQDCDIKRHEMHIGFSYEEKKRVKENPHPLFVNHFPLVEMELERKDNYAYLRDRWGIETVASACLFCPYRTNYFFNYIKTEEPDNYKKVVKFDDMLRERKPYTRPGVNFNSKLYVSKSRKPIKELKCEECQDIETFPYKDQMVWNGF